MLNIANMAFPPTSKEKMAKISGLIRAISSSKHSNFYKHIWDESSLQNEQINFGTLPTISIENIIKCKFDERLYIKNNLFVKIICHENVPYLLARTKRGIGKEYYGKIQYERPLVFFESAHESIEKGLWLHDKDILPLIAEDNLELTLMIAGRYEIDSMLADTASLKKIVSNGMRHFDYKKIINITIIDSRFEKNLLASLSDVFPSAKIQLILALPETGSLGLKCPESREQTLMFHPEENSIVEITGRGQLTITRLIELPTPIVRYKTNIKVEKSANDCSCRSELSFSLTD